MCRLIHTTTTTTQEFKKSIVTNVGSKVVKPISIAALVLVVPQIAAVLATGWLLCRMSPKAFMVKDNIGMWGGK